MPAVSDLEVQAYIAVKRTDIPCNAHEIISSESCGLDIDDCCWPIPQFVDTDDPTDLFKNDVFSWLFEKNSLQTATITITNETTGDTDTITDDTYGKYYDFGDFVTRPEVAGFEIDWLDVVDVMGYGTYTIKVEVFNTGPVLSRTDLDLCFEVMPFSCESAHGTIRFETTQTGYIHNGFDYRGVSVQFTSPSGLNFVSADGWKQQLRWYGIMYPDTPNEESDYIQMSSRIEEQIQQKITDKFKIELHRMKSDFGNHLLNDNFMATEIKVSDYNYNNYEAYRSISVRKVSTDDLGVNRMNSGINPTFTFKKVDEGTVKRIYG